MRDNGVSVLEQYDFEVRSTRKVRGAVLVDTDRGLMLLKEAAGMEGGVPALYCLQQILAEKGYKAIDMLQKNQEGQFISENEDREKYLVKNWPSGRECDIRAEAEVMRAAKNLAGLHRLMIWEEREELPDLRLRMGRNLEETYRRHNQELKKIRKFIRKKPDKGRFETIYLTEFERMYASAERAAEKLTESSCRTLCERECGRGMLCHGDYNYHNVMICGSDTATVNFEHFYRGVQMDDLYYFLRKILEKYNWKQRMCDGILNAYAKVNPLDERKMEYLAMRLIYPEKFWKTANAYYCMNKAWISERNAQKLEICIRQHEKKKKLLEDVFGA